MNKKQKRLTLRDLMHILGSKHQAFLLGSGMIQENLKNLFDRQAGPLDCKEAIKNAINDLEKIIEISKEADTLLNEIKGMVYKRLDPDKIRVSGKQRR